VSAATCTAFVDWDAAGGLCGEPSAGTLMAACIHEHIGNEPVCAGCAAELQRAAGDLICKHCADNPDAPHVCRSHLVITWLDGTTTVVQEATS
jgi:predicted amidophosphoribosyltransferase